MELMGAKKPFELAALLIYATRWSDHDGERPGGCHRFDNSHHDNECPNDLTTSNALAVTRDADPDTRLHTKYDEWKKTLDPEELKALAHTMKRVQPDLATKPNTDAIVAFYDFDSTLEEVDAKKLIEEVKVRKCSNLP